MTKEELLALDNSEIAAKLNEAIEAGKSREEAEAEYGLSKADLMKENVFFVKGKYLVGTSRIQIEKIEGPVSLFAVYIYTPAKKGWDYTRFDTSAKGKLQKRSFQRVMDKLEKFVSEKEPQDSTAQE